MLRFLVILLITIISFNKVHTQELYCNVQVMAPQIQMTDKSIFEDMQKSLLEFINGKKWTNYNYKVNEKIECNILINVTEQISTDKFKGSIQIQSRRPIYGSSYNSTLFNYIDKDFEFEYSKFYHLEYVENSSNPNLVSVVAFYVYIILGLDFDSFSLYGGDIYYQKAQTIVSNSQGASEPGWKAYESQKNRYWLIENMTNPIFKPLRQCIYVYHRLGMDVMYDKLESGRMKVLEALELLPQVHREKPSSLFMQVFFLAKSDEIVNIFSGANSPEKTRVMKVLNEVDVANMSKLSKYKNIEK